MYPAMGTTVLFSDLHLGYERFNQDEFERFLTYLEKESNVSKLLILGDIFDLWRADAIDSVTLGWSYIDKLRNLNVETHYIVGNHDYHNWLSCQTAARTDFLWLHVGYPWQMFDSVFVIHGDYFDIYALRAKVVQEAIYGVYEAIYHSDKRTIRALEQYFYDPVMLLYKWLQLYHKKPEQAKADPIAGYLEPFVDIESRQEVNKLEKGVKFLDAHPEIGARLFVPAYYRPALKAELPRFTKKRMSKQARTSLAKIDTSAPTRNLIATTRTPFEMAREISGDDNIKAVIYGHTHHPENKASQHWWNTGCWVEGESTFAEIENGNVHLYRFKNGSKTEILE
jgi:UDP-2,3-diacylglucosamine pyrophosphatase LpxH